MEKEIFKDVPGVEDIFAVSNYGNALFKRSGKISKDICIQTDII